METSAEMRAAGRLHGQLVLRVGARLERYVAAHRLGETYAAVGFQLAGDVGSVVAPDLSYVRRERLGSAEEEDGCFPGAPDLAIEVVSPDDGYGAVNGMVLDLIAAGCPMVVLVNPAGRTVTVHRSGGHGFILSGADVLDGGDVVPGWKLPLRELFS